MLMTERISGTILWPKSVAPQIDEIQFAYHFCRSVSEALCSQGNSSFGLVEYMGDPSLEELRPAIKGDHLLVITEPEIVISEITIKALTRCLKKGYAATGPAYNRTAYPLQIAALPVPYINIDTYLELAAALAERENGNFREVDTLDPACVLYPADIVGRLESDCHVSEIQNAVQQTHRKKIAVTPGALVHFSFKRSFEAERDDLVRLVPEGVKRVLDIGCAMGGYGKKLRQMRPDVFLTGVELNPTMAESARTHYDEIVISPIEAADLRTRYDLINCGDIIEHLKDPWALMAHLHGLLEADGYLTLSVPNVGHWTVIKDLLKGRFEYMPLGILCIAHLRWFTESSIRQALEVAGFRIDILEREQLPPTPKGEGFIEQMCALGLGDRTALMTNEFVIRAVKDRQKGR